MNKHTMTTKTLTRSVQFAIVYVLDVLIIYLLFRSNMFIRLGIWPPSKKERTAS